MATPLRITSVITRLVLCALAAPLLLRAADLPPVKVDGAKITTGKHTIIVGKNGLPEQITIQAAPSELPLQARKGTPAPAVLGAVGRGPILAAPVTIKAIVNGAAKDAVVKQAAQPKANAKAADCKAKLQAGDTSIDLRLTYTTAGAVTGAIQYGGGKVESLVLEIPFAGPVDTVIAGAPIGAKVAAIPPKAHRIGTGTGVVWGNSDTDAKNADTVARPGVLEQVYVGNGDYGMTWLSDGNEGWIADPKASTMQLIRSDDGTFTWRIRLVNHPTKVAKQRLNFALLLHPVTDKPADHRTRAWLTWPGAKAQTVTPTLAAWNADKTIPMLRADAAAALEGATDYALLTGPAGGDAVSVEQNHTDTYPMTLMRYLAGCHTGNVTRMQSNAVDLIRPGSNPAADRVLLGRALLHDIGLDPKSLAHLSNAGRVVSIMKEFGLFEADGKTEFIPYWRSKRVVRFGQAWDANATFATNQQNPLAEVYVSVYRRPADRNGEKYQKAMFVLVNESDQPVRDTFYILQPNAVFGGPNQQNHYDIVTKLPFKHIPDRSDWEKHAAAWTSGGSGVGKPLEDLEDHGMVGQFANAGGIESYGPTVFIPAHGFRILSGFGGADPQADKKKRGRR